MLYYRSTNRRGEAFSLATPQDMRVTCPSCGWTLTHDPKYAGRATNCPKCGHPVALADAAPQQGPTPFDERVNTRSAETDAPSVHEESIHPSQVRSGTDDAIRTIKTAAYAGFALVALAAFNLLILPLAARYVVLEGGVVAFAFVRFVVLAVFSTVILRRPEKPKVALAIVFVCSLMWFIDCVYAALMHKVELDGAVAFFFLFPAMCCFYRAWKAASGLDRTPNPGLTERTASSQALGNIEDARSTPEREASSSASVLPKARPTLWTIDQLLEVARRRKTLLWYFGLQGLAFLGFAACRIVDALPRPMPKSQALVFAFIVPSLEFLLFAAGLAQAGITYRFAKCTRAGIPWAWGIPGILNALLSAPTLRLSVSLAPFLGAIVILPLQYRASRILRTHGINTDFFQAERFVRTIARKLSTLPLSPMFPW